MSLTPLLIVTPTHRELAGTDRLAPTAIVGIGDRSADATRDAIATHQPQLILSIGFSGALDPDLRTGNIVLTENVTFAANGQRQALDSLHAQAALPSIESTGIDVRSGDTLTTSEPLLSATDKLSYRQTTDALVVDMETYWIAAAASQAGVPVLSVRTVIDEASDDLPAFVGKIMADGGRHEIRHALLALRNPANIGPMIAMAIQARKATAATRRMLNALVPGLLSHASALQKANQ